MIDALANCRAMIEYAPNEVIQLGLSQFIRERHYERHVQRMRRIYSKKRSAVADALNSLSDKIQPSGLQSGLSCLVRVADETDALTISQQAEEKGILVPAVARYARTTGQKINALILGYGALSADEIQSGVKRMFA